VVAFSDVLKPNMLACLVETMMTLTAAQESGGAKDGTKRPRGSHGRSMSDAALVPTRERLQIRMRLSAPYNGLQSKPGGKIE
jgi:hypothetical protein